MTMRTTSNERRKHVLMRLRQRVDSRRCRWVSLCRAVELSLVLHEDVGNERSLGWITYRDQEVYVIWDRAVEEICTVLGEDYAAVVRWRESLTVEQTSEAC